MCESLFEERNADLSLCFYTAYCLKTTPKSPQADSDRQQAESDRPYPDVQSVSHQERL